MYILGISRHHDSAAALLKDGHIVALAEDERFNRKKHFGGSPSEAVRFCLNHAGIALGEVDDVAYFWERWPELVHGLKHFVRYAAGAFATAPVRCLASAEATRSRNCDASSSRTR